MKSAAQILENVDFRNEYDLSKFKQHEALGFISLTGGAHREDGTDTVIGFGNPFSRDGGFDESDRVTPIVNLHEVPEEFATVSLQGKGVGPRMYPTPQAAAGYTPRPDVLGVFSFDIHSEDLLDLRGKEGNSAGRILEHAWKIRRSQEDEQGLQEVVDAVHASYGAAQVVIRTEPPRAMLRRVVERRQLSPRGWPKQFAIIRSEDIPLERIGDLRIRG